MDDATCVIMWSNTDRIIAVGQEEDGRRIFRVSSAAMSMASPVWKAMFDTTNGFRESNPRTLVEFPEDDPDIMLIILRIIHFEFEDLPESIPFDWLVELAVFCDKYDTVSIVRPFIAKWAAPWTKQCLERGYEQWLIVAWTFGCQQIFETLAAFLVLSTVLDIDDDQSAIESPSDWVHSENMPPEIVASILKVRKNAIEELLEFFHDITKSLVAGELCRDTRNSNHDKYLCNNVTLNNLFKELYKLGIGVGPQKMCACSIGHCISRIVLPLSTSSHSQSIRLAKVDPSRGQSRSGHHRRQEMFVPCNLDSVLGLKISKILQQIPSPVLDHHLRHMEEQAKRSGLGDMKVPEKTTRS